MLALDRLHLLILAYLEDRSKPVTRYEVMTSINEIATEVDRPYSPGAVYHAIKKLESQDMIKTNPINYAITPAGLSTLSSELLHASLPESFTGLLYRTLTIKLLRDQGLQKKAFDRLRIEMIKFNQVGENQAPLSHKASSIESSLIFCRQHTSLALSKIVLDLSALE